MFQHLPGARIQEIVTAFTTPPLSYDPATRGVLLGGIDPAYTGLLVWIPVSRLQLLSDLQQLNGLERLADGSVPFLTWLLNAAAVSAGTQQERVFLRAADDVGHHVSGAPGVVAADLPEYKEAIVHENDMVTWSFMAGGVAAGKSVAKLMVPRYENGVAIATPDPVIYLGTGWLIAPDLLMTNHHVVNARNKGEAAAAGADLKLQAAATTVIFDFDDENLAGVTVKVQELEAWDPALDYAILRLAPTGRTSLPIAAQSLQAGPGSYVPVNVIQHPRGQSKKYGIRNNLVSRTTTQELRYFTDTLGGSSGSPVLNDRWEVVGLHRGSSLAEDVKFQGRSTAAVNVGSQIHAILQDVKTRHPALALP